MFNDCKGGPDPRHKKPKDETDIRARAFRKKGGNVHWSSWKNALARLADKGVL